MPPKGSTQFAATLTVVALGREIAGEAVDAISAEALADLLNRPLTKILDAMREEPGSEYLSDLLHVARVAAPASARTDAPAAVGPIRKALQAAAMTSLQQGVERHQYEAEKLENVFDYDQVGAFTDAARAYIGEKRNAARNAPLMTEGVRRTPAFYAILERARGTDRLRDIFAEATTSTAYSAFEEAMWRRSEMPPETFKSTFLGREGFGEGWWNGVHDEFSRAVGDDPELRRAWEVDSYSGLWAFVDQLRAYARRQPALASIVDVALESLLESEVILERHLREELARDGVDAPTSRLNLHAKVRQSGQ